MDSTEVLGETTMKWDIEATDTDGRKRIYLDNGFKLNYHTNLPGGPCLLIVKEGFIYLEKKVNSLQEAEDWIDLDSLNQLVKHIIWPPLV